MDIEDKVLALEFKIAALEAENKKLKELVGMYNLASPCFRSIKFDSVVDEFKESE